MRRVTGIATGLAVGLVAAVAPAPGMPATVVLRAIAFSPARLVVRPGRP